ncbi:hypothetical protein PsorP6_011980 [Peronosclerospora sorghi]|uniref:Uncharacterized protein n=1 Tax=Peronosclerospora sorghi TaxID=230839 RepID=A0ACC0WIU4_9STRA|nr:hypothetical protein PsorP6_011980 [Peronosclerospora sorghi]
MSVSKSFKNAFQVLTPVREYGVGKRVTREIWSKYAEPSYWEVVRIRPSPDLKHGKIFGRFTFRGELFVAVLGAIFKTILNYPTISWTYYNEFKSMCSPSTIPHFVMQFRALLSVLWLSFFSWRHGVALQIITTSDELEDIERSAKLYSLLLIGTQAIAQDIGLEDLAIQAYPTLPGLENELEGFVTFGVIDVSKHLKDPIAKKWRHTKLPALNVYKGPPKKNPYTGKLYRDSTLIDAAMLDSPKELKKLLKESIPTEFVHKLEREEATLTSFNNMVQQNVEDSQTVILLVSKQKDASPVFRAVATEFHDQGLQFVFLNLNEQGAEEIMENFEVVNLPAIIAMQSMTEHVMLSAENMRTYKELKSFVEPFVLQNKGEARDYTDKETSNIIKFFRNEEFDELVLDSTVTWVIDFVDSVRKRALDGEKWKKILAELHRKVGMVGLGAVNCEQEVELCERYGGPGIRIFPLRLTDDKKPKRDDVFPQTFASIDDAKNVAVALVPDLSVEIASSIELNAFISKARENHALPILFFTTKNYTPPMIRALLLSIPTQKIELAIIHDATEDLKKQFLAGSSASTSLVCLVPTETNPQEPTASPPFGVLAYSKKAMGSFTYPNILRFVLQVLAKYPHPQDSQLESNELDAVSLDDGSAQALVPYVTKQNFDDLCVGNKICVIGFFEDHLDTLHDPESRLAKAWTTLAHVASRSKQKQEPFSFMWVNGKCQKDFAEAFGVGLFQMPTVAVYSPSKQRYATNFGLFDEESVAAFLESVLSGRISTSPIGDMPALREECSVDAIQATVDDDAVEDDQDLKDMLSEILSEEKQQRDELEKEETKVAKKSKKKQKSKQKKSKKKAARDEL